jgi:hypothetical protein
MKQLISTFLLVFVIVGSVWAQQNRYIYIQTDNKQPFYAKLQSKVYSSTANGFLIIPRLKDGSYQLLIGYPNSTNTEKNYECKIEGKDLGFAIKDIPEQGGTVLFNLQSFATVKATDPPANLKKENKPDSNAVATNTGKSDAFGEMLSSATGDTSLKATPILTDSTAFIVKNDPITISKDSMKNEVPPFKKEEVQPPVVMNTNPIVEEKKEEKPAITNNEIVNTKNDTPVYKESIKKKIQIESANGVDLVFENNTAPDKTETIRIFIPKEAPVVKTEIQPDPIVKKEEQKVPPVNEEVMMQKDTVAIPVKKEEMVTVPAEIKLKKDTQVVNNTPPVVVDQPKKDTMTFTLASNTPPVVKEETTKPDLNVNRNCVGVANDDDFYKLRKQMVSEDNTDEMILIAKKFMKSKCFSTQQVKNLCGLFLTDADRYQFMDAAYNFVLDRNNFSTLQSQLVDPYFINRFKAMISQK